MKIVKKLYEWCTKTRIRKILSSVLAILILLTSIRFIFLSPKEVKAADVYLGLDEGYGTSTADKNSTITSLTITNAVWKSEEFCKFGKCLFFDGAGDYATVTDASTNGNLDFSAAESFSVEGWFRHAPKTTGTDVMAVKMEGTGNDGGYRVKMESDGDITCEIDGGDANATFSDVITSAAASYDDNKWHHFACVKATSSTLTLYLDGTQVAQVSLAEDGNVANDDAFYIGIDGDGSSNPFTGFMDEIKVYRSIRTVDQIKTDIGGFSPDQGISASFSPNQDYISNGLIGYWPMDDTASPAIDKSGNGHNGTWNGSPSSAAGKFGQTPDLNGTSQYVSMGDQSSHDLTFPFTLSNWIKIDQLPGTAGADFEIISKYGGATQRQWTFAIGTDNVLYFWKSHDGTSGEYLTVSPYTFSASDINVWRLVSITCTSQGKCSTFVDSTLKETTTATNLTINTVSNSNLIVGARSTSPVIDFFDGRIDEVRIYNRSLSDTEIQKLYNWAPGPVAYYNFDENTGTSTVFDRSTNGNNGAMQGSMTSSDWVPGKFGSALDFDGVDDNLDLLQPDATDNLPSNAFTVSVWVNMKTLVATNDTRRIIVGKSNSTDFKWHLGTRGNGSSAQWEATIDNVGTSRITVTTSTNTWVHLTYIYDNNAASRVNRIYVNGIEGPYTAQTAVTGTYTGDATRDLTIGSYSNDNSYVHAAIDDLKIFNYVRSPGQIIEDMNGGHPAPGSPVGSAALKLKFDEGYGDTAYDSSGNGRNGDLADSGTVCPTGADDACPSWSNSGKFGKAIDLETANVDDFVRVNHDFINAYPFTFSAWILKEGDVNGHFASVGDSSVSNRSWSLRTSSSVPTISILDGGTSDTLSSGVSIDDGKWHHVVGVFESSTSRKIYVDGSLKGSSSTNIAFNSAVNRFSVGEDADNSTTVLWDGLIDEVHVYLSVLNDEQVKLLYNQGFMAVMGSTSTDSSGNASWSDTDAYCPPGQGTTCTPPVGHWKFDENNFTTTASATAYDSSGNNNNLTTNFGVSSYPINKPGKMGSSFDPTLGTTTDHNRWAAITDDSDLDITGPITLTAWINLNTISSCSGALFTVMAKGTSTTTFTDSTQLSYRMAVACSGGSQANGVQILVSNLGTDETETSSGTIPTDPVLAVNTWYHFAGVYDGSTLKAYLNGKLFSSTTYSSGIFNSSGDFRIGGLQYAGGGGLLADFPGMIDDVRVYNYARSQPQIAWDYNRGKPVGWWKMDENTGSIANDSSGFTNTGTLINTPTWATGKVNSALSFNSAQSEDVSIANESFFDFERTQPFSISSWINTSTTATEAKIFSKLSNTAPNTGYEFFVNTSNTLQAYLINSWSGNAISVSGTTSVTDGNWHHVLMTYDGSSSANGINFYIDGKTDGKGINVNTLSSSILNNITPRIGSRNNTNFFFNGALDEVKVFNYALNSTQAKNLYSEGAAVKFAPLTGTP